MGQHLFLNWMVSTELPGPSIANVAVRMSTEENGVVMLTPQAVNYREFRGCGESPFRQPPRRRQAFASILNQDRAEGRPGQRGDKAHQPAQLPPRHGHPPVAGGSEGSDTTSASAREETKINGSLYLALCLCVVPWVRI